MDLDTKAMVVPLVNGTTATVIRLRSPHYGMESAMVTFLMAAARILAVASVALASVAGASYRVNSTIRVEYIQIPVSDTADARARALAEQVRAEALKGAAFSALARRFGTHRDRQVTSGTRGFSMFTLKPEIRAGLENVGIGEISQVLVNPAGFNIFKVMERKPGFLASVEASVVVRDLSTAIHGPTVELRPGNPTTADLGSTDPIWGEVLTDSTSEDRFEYRTHFDLFRVAVDKPGAYELTVTPKCNCSGLRKTIVLPIVRVLSSTGEILARESGAGDLKGTPTSRIEGSFPSAGDYFVLVGANNLVPGAIVGSSSTVEGVSDRRPAGIPVPVDLASTGEGKYTAELKLLGNH